MSSTDEGREELQLVAAINFLFVVDSKRQDIVDVVVVVERDAVNADLRSIGIMNPTRFGG